MWSERRRRETARRGLWAGPICLALICLALVGPPAARLALGAPASEPIAIIVHPQNRLATLSKSHLAALFLRKRKTWPSGKPVLVINAAPRSHLRQAFDRGVLGLTPTQAADYWIDYRIRGYGRPPRSVRSASLLLRLVARQPSAIAYLPLSQLDQTGATAVKVLRVEGKSPDAGGYPLRMEAPRER